MTTRIICRLTTAVPRNGYLGSPVLTNGTRKHKVLEVESASLESESFTWLAEKILLRY